MSFLPNAQKHFCQSLKLWLVSPDRFLFVLVLSHQFEEGNITQALTLKTHQESATFESEFHDGWLDYLVTVHQIR